jgi:hypothetical protein
MVAAAAVLMAAACHPQGSGRDAPDQQIITEQQVEESRGANALEVIQRVRPNFLHDRGETSLSKSRSAPYPTVYVDGQEFGPISSLRLIPASQIATIRLYRAWESATIYGSGNGGGVIAITTRR